MSDVVLKIDGICKKFGSLEASKNITLDVRAGEIHALIGPNGAGKSTLIRQIAGDLRPDAGTISLNNELLTEMNVAQRAKLGLARSFQVSALAMEDTALENAMLGAIGAIGTPYWPFGSAFGNKKIRARAEHALERVGLSDYARTPTAELSHGQRRQLEVALALTSDPKVFVMDEPMAGLGTQGSLELTKFLDELRSQAPILLVEHDMDAVFALADRVSVLVYGEVIATGTVAEIRRDPVVQRAYLGEDA